MTDPTQVHGAECARCQNWQADNETDLNEAGFCWSCDEEMAEEDEEESTLIAAIFDIASARWSA